MKFSSILQELSDDIFYKNRFFLYPLGFLLVVVGGSLLFILNYFKDFFKFFQERA